MGLEKKKEGSGGDREGGEGRGVKRKFELDEEEMLRNAKEERGRARKAIDEEKVGFCWVSLSIILNTQPGGQTNPPLLLGPLSDTLNKWQSIGECFEPITCMPCVFGKNHTPSLPKDSRSHHIHNKQGFLELD